jgi:regulator of replication initiation timing
MEMNDEREVFIPGAKFEIVTEVSKLRAEVERLTAENARLTDENKDAAYWKNAALEHATQYTELQAEVSRLTDCLALYQATEKQLMAALEMVMRIATPNLWRIYSICRDVLNGGDK